MLGALAPISFASSRFRDFAKQIEYLRQPDWLSLRAFGSKRISVSLLALRPRVSAGLLNGDSHIWQLAGMAAGKGPLHMQRHKGGLAFMITSRGVSPCSFAAHGFPWCAVYHIVCMLSRARPALATLHRSAQYPVNRRLSRHILPQAADTSATGGGAPLNCHAFASGLTCPFFRPGWISSLCPRLRRGGDSQKEHINPIFAFIISFHILYCKKKMENIYINM